VNNNSSHHPMIPAFWFLPLLTGLIRFKPQVRQKQVFAGRNPTLVDICVLESKLPIEELKSYGRLGPESVMFNYSGCAGIIVVEADRLGVSIIYSSDVNRGSKNRNSLQFRVLEIEFLNSKLHFTFLNFCKCNIFHANKLTFSLELGRFSKNGRSPIFGFFCKLSDSDPIFTSR